MAVALPAAAAPPGRGGRLLFEVVPPQLAPQFLPGGPVHLWSAGPDGASPHDLGVVAGNSDEFVDARFTPDGRKIVFLHALREPNNPAVRYSLELMNADGSGRRVLIRRPYLAHFALGPDGRSVAVNAIVGRGSWAIYLTSVARPQLRLLSRTGALGAIAWRRPGRLLVLFAADACVTGTCLIDTRTGAATPVPIPSRRYAHAPGAPAVSPDGGTIAFYSPVGPAGVRIFGIDGRFRRNVAGVANVGVGPFSPDGTQLAVTDWPADAPEHVSVLDVRSRKVEPLDPRVPVPVGGYDRLLDWAPLPAR